MTPITFFYSHCTWIANSFFVFFCALLALFSSQNALCAETDFDKAVGLARLVDAMNVEFQSSESERQQIVAQLATHTKTLKMAFEESRQLQSAGLQQSFLVALKSIERRLIEFRRNEPGKKSVEESSILASYQVQNMGQLVVAVSQLSQLSSAGKKATERVSKLTGEIRRLSDELSDIVDRQSKSFENYSDLADIYGMRSKLELKTLLREASRTTTNNLGARYLKAVTLRRLGRFDEAEDEFSELSLIPSKFQAQVLASRAENLQHLGRSTEAKRLFGTLTIAKLTDNEVAGCRGIFEVVAGDFKGAQRAWEKALAQGEREVPIRRNLALIQAMQPAASLAVKKQALEHAELASELSRRGEWSVEAARAIALFVNDQSHEAQLAMDLAMQLCGGECQAYCQSIFEELESGRSVEWDFVKH